MHQSFNNYRSISFFIHASTRFGNVSNTQSSVQRLNQGSHQSEFNARWVGVTWVVSPLHTIKPSQAFTWSNILTSQRKNVQTQQVSELFAKSILLHLVESRKNRTEIKQNQGKLGLKKNSDLEKITPALRKPCCQPKKIYW